MEKINFKVDYGGLISLVQYLTQTVVLPYMTREEKVVATVMMKVEKKLQKKCIDKRGTTKPFKIGLEYYEAFAFEKVCRSIFETASGSADYFTGNEALMIANEIDKQL